MVPHLGSDAVAGTQAEFGDGLGEAPRAVVEVSVGAANNGAVGSAGDNFDAVEKLAGTLQNRRERQRKIHHCAAHILSFPARHRFGGIVSLFGSHRCLNPKGGELPKGAISGTGITEANRAPGLDSFPLQKGLIFERMPLTAEVPVSLPAVARLPRLPVT